MTPSSLMAKLNPDIGLSKQEDIAFRRAMRRLQNDLRERKGLNCQVLVASSDALTLFVPALVLGDAQVNELLRMTLKTSIGDVRTEGIWKNPGLIEKVRQMAQLETLETDVSYEFKKISGPTEATDTTEARPATFWLECKITPRSDAATANDVLAAMRVTQHQGIDYLGASNVFGFGWNALAKAPAGFFRPEPILGVASRPPPAVYIEEQIDQGTADVFNLSGPGSHEVLKTD